MPISLWCPFCDDGKRAARFRSCTATEAATAPLMAETSADDCRNGSGREYAPLLTRTEDCQGRGVGARVELHGDGPEPPLTHTHTHTSRSSSASTTKSGSRPDRLAGVRPQQRVQWHTVDQTVDAVPGLPTLDAPVPLVVDQLVDVLRFVDALVLVAEQVIEVPKIILENIPPRRLVRDPQLAEQLVAVPTPSPAHDPVPCMEDQLVEVPQIVTHIVPRSFFVSTDGNVWSQLSGPSGVYWWRCGTSHTQWTPTGVHRQARAVHKYWPGVVDVPSIMQLVFQQSKSYVFFPRFSSLDRVLDIPVVPQKGDSTVQSLNKVVAVVVYDSCPWSRQCCSCVHRQGR